MTRFVAMLGIALVATRTTAAAQSANVPVSVTLTNNISISSTGTTNFGSVPNTPGVVSVSAQASGPTQTAGRFTITSDANRTLVFSCPATVTLTNTTTPSATLAFTSTFASASSALGPLQNIGAICPGSSIQSGGTLVLAMGGSVTVANNQVSGAYTGTFTMTVSY